MNKQFPLHGRLAILAASLLLVSGCTQARQFVSHPFGDPIKEREMRFSFAQVTEREGNLHRAEETYRELVKEQPKDARYQHRLGIVLVRQGKLDEGVESLAQASALHKDDVAILNDLGYAYLLKGEFASAEQQFRAALALDARNSRTHNNLALAVGFSGRTQEAYELFRQHQSEAEARANLAYVLTQRGELVAATREYDRSLTKDPNNKPAAEALVQLTELRRDCNAAEDSRPDVQLASGASELDRSEPEVEQRAPSPREQLRRQQSDLIELLGNIEAEAVPSPSKYDWQSMD